jgi:ubiquitin carboxyl-terminal hydrolase L3
MWGLGVPEDVGLCDVYGIDDEMLSMVPQPVLAVLLLYPQVIPCS